MTDATSKVLWCTLQGTVEMRDLNLSETIQVKEQILRFNSLCSLVAPVPNSSCIIFAASNVSRTYFRIYDIAQNMKNVYSSPRIIGCTYDIAWNEKTNRVAFISRGGNVLYHLYDCSDWKCALMKHTSTASPYNRASSLSFSPEGDKIAITHLNGYFYVRNVAITRNLFELPIAHLRYTPLIYANKCRWNPIRPLVSLHTYVNERCLNFVDIVTQKFLLTDNIEFSKKKLIEVTWHKDGQLITVCTAERAVKVYDIREGDVVRTFKYKKVKSRKSTYPVVWSPDGTQLCFTGEEKKTRIVDFASLLVKLFMLSILLKSEAEEPGVSVCFK